MYKLCKTEQSAERQRALELGLQKYMLTRRYDEISVSDLCAYLNIPRKAFYRYFSSREGALYALIDHTIMRFEDFFTLYRGKNKRTLNSELCGFFQYWLDQKELLIALDKSGLIGLLVERAIFHVVNERLIPARFLAADSAEIQKHVAMFCSCGLMSMALNWYRDGFNVPIPEMAKTAARLLMQPLFPNAETLI